MVIYFIAALLISGMVYKLGAYSTIIGLMVTAGKISVVVAVIAAVALIYRRYIGKWRKVKLIGGSQEKS